MVQLELLLPLTREDELREVLDELFYEDTLARLVRAMGPRLAEVLPRRPGERRAAHVARAVRATAQRFSGYSITHVRGRYRAADSVRTRREAAGGSGQAQRYLVDETTAVVRFLVPLAGSRVEHGDAFEVDGGLGPRPAATAVPRNAEEIRVVRG